MENLRRIFFFRNRLNDLESRFNQISLRSRWLPIQNRQFNAAENLFPNPPIRNTRRALFHLLWRFLSQL
jgi:hypothetical protein